ncbi:hypothetical protein COK06_12490 [Bacillus cereus]|uniref:hypothetical protein n=1 Tax=Bacillus nitratireducens TaxID=2026193 RepID=UPI000BEB71E9|nr:hypothetical protein [Bacillus nitratireducens]PEA21241.1 hypothetical protein CON40_10765 [Bacillus cereus]PEW01793.1 hypothetical protein CN428_15285 [Bacillus cereus]PEZ87323.1 hypothetical protein CN374_18745 [Bacillus cereus]PFA30136.1 hypothetical protein CN390_20545 [Bacillus cereus]PFB96326.1 hypothetical protein CN296_18260 [Bacillus cereus]
MIPVLEYEDLRGNTLRIEYTLGSINFFITDEYRRPIHLIFSEKDAYSFISVLQGNKSTELIDREGKTLRFQALNDGCFGISIKSKKTRGSFRFNQIQTKGLISRFQSICDL